jgi:hypothetical protein
LLARSFTLFLLYLGKVHTHFYTCPAPATHFYSIHYTRHIQQISPEATLKTHLISSSPNTP